MEAQGWGRRTHDFPLTSAARPPGFFLAGRGYYSSAVINISSMLSQQWRAGAGSSSVVAGVITSCHPLSTSLCLHRTLTNHAVSSQPSRSRIAPEIWKNPPAISCIWLDQTVANSLVSFNWIWVVDFNVRCLYWPWKFSGVIATMSFMWPTN